MKIALILLAGGIGSRMKSEIPKQFLPLSGKPIALHSFSVFEKMSAIDQIVVVVEDEWQDVFAASKKPIVFASPGKRRQDSVWSGLQKVAAETDLVLIHDAARPFVTEEMTLRLIEEVKCSPAATLGMPVKFTVKESTSEGFVVRTPNRENVWEIQTPQALLKKVLLEGFGKAHGQNLTVTDDVSLAELCGYPVKLIPGSYQNLKITTPEDLHVAEEYAKL